MDNVIISKLEKQDIFSASELVQLVHNKMMDNRQDIFIPKQENWEEYLKNKLEDNEYELLVARVQDKVVGVCVAEKKHLGDDIETRIRDILFIEYIVVDENYRRCKIGTKLLEKIKDIAKEKNISSVELNVWGFNCSAIEFYENNNMKPKRIVYEYFIKKEN